MQEYVSDISFNIDLFEEEIVIAFTVSELELDPVIKIFPNKDLLEVHLYCDPLRVSIIIEKLFLLNDYLDRPKDKLIKYSKELIEKKDWLVHWQKHFYPIIIDDVIQVTPSWEPLNPHLPNLILEPKMGFGTGQHATTHLCLKEIVSLYKAQKIKGANVLDVGAGSGILGAAALILEANHSSFLEIDEQSIESCYDTITRNHLHHKASVFHADILNDKGDWVNQRYDICFMNIIAEVIIKILPLPMIKNIPIIILSGILDKKFEIVDEALKREGYSIVTQNKEKEWMTLKVKPYDL